MCQNYVSTFAYVITITDDAKSQSRFRPQTLFSPLPQEKTVCHYAMIAPFRRGILRWDLLTYFFFFIKEPSLVVSRCPPLFSPSRGPHLPDSDRLGQVVSDSQKKNETQVPPLKHQRQAALTLRTSTNKGTSFSHLRFLFAGSFLANSQCLLPPGRLDPHLPSGIILGDITGFDSFNRGSTIHKHPVSWPNTRQNGQWLDGN